METKRSRFLALGFTMVLAALASGPVHSLPPPCEEICDASTSCDTQCSAFNFTCGDYGVCEPPPCNTISGTSGHDTLNGTWNDDCIYGFAGDDTLNGSDGNDSVYGDAGNDHLTGGAGDDFLDGGSGSDYINGGSGNDFCTAGETYVDC